MEPIRSDGILWEEGDKVRINGIKVTHEHFDSNRLMREYAQRHRVVHIERTMTRQGVRGVRFKEIAGIWHVDDLENLSKTQHMTGKCTITPL